MRGRERGVRDLNFPAGRSELKLINNFSNSFHILVAEKHYTCRERITSG